MNVETARLKWPKKASLIKSDVKDFLKNSKTQFYEYYVKNYNLDVNTPDTFYESGDTPLADTGNVMVITVYLKPTDMVEKTFLKKDEKGEKEKEIFALMRKYPKGRMITIASGAVIEDEPLPYDDGLFPFSKYNNYILPREFWGVSEVEQLESPQRIFNKILSYSLDVLLLCSNPMWIFDTNSTVDTDNIYNVPGGIIEKRPGSEVRRVEGSSLNPAFMNMLSQIETWVQTVSGNPEVSMGMTPGSVTAASAIEQLTSNARTRIKQKMRNLDEYLRDVGKQYVNRVFQFYQIPRVFAVTEDNGSQKYFRMSISSNEQGQKVANITEFDEETGNELEVKQMIIKGNFDVRVNTGSALPFTAADRERKSLSLFDRQIIDAEQVLDDIEHPNKETILERLAQREQVALEMQQQQQQQVR